MLIKEFQNKKVLLGCPTYNLYDYCLDKYAEMVKSLTYPNYDLLLVDNSPNDEYLKKIESLKLPVKKGTFLKLARKRIVASMNILREKVLKEGYDYLLILEQDVIPPKDVIEQLLSHNKKIIGGIYFIPQNEYKDKSGQLVPVVWVIDGDFSLGNLDGMAIRIMHPKETEGNQLVKVVYCGTGCLMIHRDVLEKIKFRYDEFFPYFHDKWFCRDAFYEGFDVWVDTKVKCKHLIENKPFSWTDIKK